MSVYKIIQRTPVLFGSSAKVVKKALAGKEKIKEIKRFAAISLFGWKFIGIFAGMKHLKALKPIVLLLCLAVCVSGMQARKKEGTWRPKVGVVLSGGGVKGAAHVSILKAIEQAGIPIDYIVGTSMGSIVGGLYAMGIPPTNSTPCFGSRIGLSF